MILIAFLTLQPERGAPQRAFADCITCGTFGSINFLLNMVLFVPLGVALRIRHFAFLAAVIVCAATTLAVELLQLLVIAGRQASLGDLVSNTLGGVAGWVLVGAWPLLSRPEVRTARALTVLQAVAMCAAAMASGWLFELSPAGVTYFGQLTPEMRNEGRVVVMGASLNGFPFRQAAFPESLTSNVELLMSQRRLDVSVDLLQLEEMTRSSTMLRVADEDAEDIARIGLAGTTTLFRVRTRATDFELYQPQLAIPDAMRCDSCASGFFAEPLRVSGQRINSRYTLSVTGNAVSRVATLDITPNMLWLAFLPFSVTGNGGIASVSALWVLAQAFVFAYWLTWAIPSRTPLVLTGIGAGITALTQFGVPQWLAIQPAPVTDMIALAAGYCGGTLLALRFMSRFGAASAPPVAFDSAAN